MNSNHPFGWDLPPGCSHADIDRAMGGDCEERECETCNGEGYVSMPFSELTLWEKFLFLCKIAETQEPCPDCHGDGFILLDEAALLQEAEERALDAADWKRDLDMDRLKDND